MKRAGPRIAGALLLLVVAGWLGFVALAGHLVSAPTVRDRARTADYSEQIARRYADRVVASGRAKPSAADLEALRYAETAILRTRELAGLTVLLRIDVGPVRTCYAEDFHDLGSPQARYDVTPLGSCS